MVTDILPGWGEGSRFKVQSSTLDPGFVLDDQLITEN